MRKQHEQDISWLRFFAYLIFLISAIALAITVFNQLIVKPAEAYDQRTSTKHN